MATVPAEVQNPSDGELLEQVRGGSTQAYGELYERHVAAAYNMARQVAKSAAEADDLVSEAFAKVLDALREGRGPTSAFRAYLLTSLRHAAYDRTRRERKVQLADDVAEVSGADVSVPFNDTAVAGLERTLAAQAFARLPERWQTVLWHIEIEGQSPAEIAPLLGLTPNGVSALAYRAREGLRQAYLQVHLGQLEASGDGGVHAAPVGERTLMVGHLRPVGFRMPEEDDPAGFCDAHASQLRTKHAMGRRELMWSPGEGDALPRQG